jgi:hypothetical protein
MKKNVHSEKSAVNISLLRMELGRMMPVPCQPPGDVPQAHDWQMPVM